jgi:DNA polymerase-3 subunit delta
MTALKAHEVARYLDRPDLPAGVLLVYGPDAGLVRESAQRLIAHYAAGDDGALTTMEGSDIEADPGRLAVEAGTGSLFSARRVVRVRNPGRSLATPLAAFADDPGDAVIIVEGGNLTPRDALRALIEKSPRGRALPCFPDSAETLVKLIGNTFSAAGITADPEVATTLREALGNDREVTRRELEKLVLFAHATKVLTREDVLTLCGDNAQLLLDQVLDATGTGHPARLEGALDRAFSAAMNPQQILSMALSHFTQLRRWRTEVDAGRSAREVLDGARPRPHFSRRAALEQQVRLWSDTALAAAMARLQRATLESRERYGLTETVARRALLALATMAAEH